MRAYVSPCSPCDYNYYAVDPETGDCLYDECRKPEDGFCWIEEWVKEKHDELREDK